MPRLGFSRPRLGMAAGASVTPAVAVADRSPEPEARSPLLLPLHARNHFLADVLRRRLVPIEVHRVGRTSLRARPEVRRVAEHLRERHARLNDLRAPTIFLRLDVPAPACEVAHHVAHV